MEETCRLCLSQNLVNNFIFDEDNKIYLKILSCLPIKISRDDILPKKICDICSCKVDEFYQFCHRSIDSENRLSITNPLSKLDLNDAHIENDNKIYQFTSSFLQFHKNGFTVNDPSNGKCLTSSGTQTESEGSLLQCNIKVEPITSVDYESCDDDFADRDMVSYDNKIEEFKHEVPISSKKIEKTSNKTSSKKKSVRKDKKEKGIKLKIKTKKSKYSIKKNSDSEEDVSLIDMLKKDKSEPTIGVGDNITSGELVLEMKDIKLEIMENLAPQAEPGVENTQREEWNCCICFYRSYEREDMLAHYRITHCTTGGFVDSERVKPEIIMDENGQMQEIFLCPHCNERSKSKAHHLRHLRRHGFDKPYRCTLCEKTFRNATEILKHGKKSHKYDGLQDPAGKVEGEEGMVGPIRALKRFMCDLCDETFVYMKYVQIHRNLCHPEAKGRTFVNRCLHCGREFAHLNSLRRHLRSHSGERNFLCYICGKSLSSREHLKFHIRIHTGFKPHICKTCGKGFVKKCNLTLHERVHSGEKPHVCSHCGKAFSQRSTLVIHERYHSGARPYVCSICNKGFVAKGLLSMHLKSSCI